VHERLWNEAVTAAAERPTPITASFINILNETIDFEATRVAAKRNHRAYCRLAAFVMRGRLWSLVDGLGGGNRQGHPFLARFLFPLLIAVVIALIIDIDTPRGGLITVTSALC
jgi:uncharacterized membrane protein